MSRVFVSSVDGVCYVEETDRQCVITNFLENMDKNRHDNLDVFDESHMDAGACISSGFVKYRKLMEESSIDRQNKTKRFKVAVSELQEEFHQNQAELAKCKNVLVAMTHQLHMAQTKNVA